MCMGGSKSAPAPEPAPPPPPPPPVLDQEAPEKAGPTEGDKVKKKAAGTKPFRAASLAINSTSTGSSKAGLNVT